MDWIGLAFFALLILLTEGLSIDLYVRDTSISTASAPLIAGALLYGPQGALMLSLVLALTAMIKHRSKISRFIFNSSNHFISSSLVPFLVLLTSVSFVAHPAHVQFSLALLSGSIVYFVSTLLLSGVMSLSMNQPFRQVWSDRFRWLLPYYMAFGVTGYALILGYNSAGILGLVAVLLPLLTLRVSQAQYIDNTKSMVSQLRAQNLALENKSNEISSLNEDLLLSLANVIDLRDTATMGHSKGVSDYAVLIAKELGLSDEHIEWIHKSGLLHDIGKIGIPDTILFKPSRLTVEEFEIIKQHPGRGAEIVQANHSLSTLSPIIRHHHERYDGKGYPDGLRDQEIPLEARILGLADAVQAMSSDRPYRKALSLPKIISEVRENTGTQFDPRVVKAFLDGLPKMEAILSTTTSYSRSMDEPELVEIIPAKDRQRFVATEPQYAQEAIWKVNGNLE
jgi:putative nucleotidyltransferase with HDIG domain